MSEENQQNSTDSPEENVESRDNSQSRASANGPTFTESPDPLAGVKKSTGEILDSMEGKTVSMKTYVGTIIGVIVLMLLARCGG